LKNSLCSAKHYWKDTCFIASPQDLEKHISEITYFWACNGNEHALSLVAREMIATAPIFHAFAGEMPVTKEFRVFATDGKLDGWQPYWPEYAIKDPSIEDWKERLAEISTPSPSDLEEMQQLSEKITKKLGGFWSVDFLADKNGKLWLIDMAEGKKSFRCEVGFQAALPRPSQSETPAP